MAKGKSSQAREKPSGKSKRKAGARIEVVSSKLRYDGPLFQVYTDIIREHGRESRRDVVRHHGSVVILAVDEAARKGAGKRDPRIIPDPAPDPLIIMERQYRHAAAQTMLELPAGTLNPGEDPLRGAKRELIEETGLRARRWRKLARIFPSPGFLSEWMQIFLAEGLTQGEAAPEDDEHIEIEAIPLSRVLAMIQSGAIQDAKTIVATLSFDRTLRSANLSLHARRTPGMERARRGRSS